MIKTRVGEDEQVAGHRLTAGEARMSRIYAENIARLTSLACLLSGDSAVAEDLAQDVFVHVLRSAAQDPDHLREPAWPYLRAVLVNLAMRRRRSRLREHLRALRAYEPPVADWPRSTSDFVGALRSLPPRMRACAVLFYVEDLSRAEVATVLGCSPRTVQAQLAQARPRLRDRLRDREEA